MLKRTIVYLCMLAVLEGLSAGEGRSQAREPLSPKRLSPNIERPVTPVIPDMSVTPAIPDMPAAASSGTAPEEPPHYKGSVNPNKNAGAQHHTDKE